VYIPRVPGKPRQILLASVIFLSGCGGGGGEDGVPIGSSVTFSGTVAIGEPLAGHTVAVVHESGAAAFATTDSAGRYSVTLTGLPAGSRPLFMIQTTNPVAGAPANAPMAYPRMYSIAANRTSGTVNVTPLTSLQVASLLDRKQGSFTDFPAMRSVPTPSNADFAAARQEVIDYLLQRPNPSNGNLTVPVSTAGVGDFISTPFSAAPGDPHDDAVERLAQTLMNGETIEGVEEHMLARNDPPANLAAILSLEFDAQCTAGGLPNPALPVGRVAVSLRSNGEIVLRSLSGGAIYAYTLAANDRITVTTAPFFDDRWRIDFNGTGTNDHLEIIASGKNLSSLALQLPAAVSTANCTPVEPVPLGARKPSVFSQVRLLGSSITNPAFNCLPGSGTFPSIPDGGNSLAIELNGVLRVATGYRLHLPSLGASLSAEVVSNFGAPVTRLRTAAFARSFVGGFDSFGLTLDAAGVIQTIDFGQRRNDGPSDSKRCPI
jgi:hypothetical protein